MDEDMGGLNVGSRVGDSCYMGDGNGNQNVHVTGMQPGETVMQPSMIGEVLQDTYLWENNDIYRFDPDTRMNGDEYQGAGAQEGVPNPTWGGNMYLNAEQSFVGKVGSLNITGNNGIVSDAASSIEVVGLNDIQSRVSQGQLIDVQLSYVEEKDIKHVALIPKSREEESRTEEEGKFYVSDLVWGKVRSHPWWPGQIFEPSAASKKAMKYCKRDTYLIAYFGDQTFAWNEVSQIKPYLTYFNQMEKQSHTESFCRAVNYSLDEVSRRIEFGLSCTCVPKAVQYIFKPQIVVNAGIQAESSQRDGGDKLSTVASFSPGVLLRRLKSIAASPCCVVDRLGFVVTRSQLLAFNRWKGYNELDILSTVASFSPGVLLQHLKSIATSPCCLVDRLGFVVARSQLLAFNHWKGYKELPAVEVLRGLLEYDADTIVLLGLEGSVLGWSDNASAPSGKRRRRSKHNECLGKIEKLMPGNISSLPDVGKDYKDETEMSILSSNKHHKASNLISSERKIKRRNKLLSSGTGSIKSAYTKKLLQRATAQLGGATTVINSGAEFLPSDEVLLNLSLAAKDPTNGFDILAPFANFFFGLRKFTSSENSKLKDHEILVQQCRGETSSNYEITESSAFDGTKDSYWTDRIIQGHVEEKVLCEPEEQDDKNTPVGQSDIVVDLNPGADEQERGAVFMQSVVENPSVLVDEQGNLMFMQSEVENPSGLIDGQGNLMFMQSEVENPSGLVDGQGNLMFLQSEVENPSSLIDGQRNLMFMQSEVENPSGLVDGQGNLMFMQSEVENPSGLVDGQGNLVFLKAEVENPSGLMDGQGGNLVFMQAEVENPSGLLDGQGNLEEQVLFELETPDEKNSPVVQADAVVGLDPDADKEERDEAMIMRSEAAEGPSGFVDGETEEDCPTALILNFKNLESVPLASDLNKVFSNFGALDESQTEGMHKTKRAKVVFKRRVDAETAFNSAGKYSIFGPSLISYRLNYAPRLRKVPVSTRKRRKTASAESNEIQS